MSDRDLRQVLQEVMADIDAGRLQVGPRRRWRSLKAALGGSALALSLSLGVAACNEPVEAYGVPPTDARVDAGADVDGGPVVEYGVPEVDGAVLPDGGVQADADVDGGPVVDYGVPEVDAGPMPEYGSP